MSNTSGVITQNNEKVLIVDTGADLPLAGSPGLNPGTIAHVNENGLTYIFVSAAIGWKTVAGNIAGNETFKFAGGLTAAGAAAESRSFADDDTANTADTGGSILYPVGFAAHTVSGRVLVPSNTLDTTATIALYKNGSSVLSQALTAGQTGSFSLVGDVTFAPGDTLELRLTKDAGTGAGGVAKIRAMIVLL